MTTCQLLLALTPPARRLPDGLPARWGAAEPLYITALPRNLFTTLGKVSDVSFNNISCVSEGGLVFAGG